MAFRNRRSRGIIDFVESGIGPGEPEKKPSPSWSGPGMAEISSSSEVKRDTDSLPSDVDSVKSGEEFRLRVVRERSIL
jgi:hypothetical protein